MEMTDHRGPAGPADLRGAGGLAVRMLTTAVDCARQRDAARANVVLGFERDATAHPELRDVIAVDRDMLEMRMRARVRGLIERVIDLALRIADLARLSARRGAPEAGELERVCRLGAVTAGTARNLLAAAGSAREPLADVLEELLLRAEISAARAARQLERGRVACLAS